MGPGDARRDFVMRASQRSANFDIDPGDVRRDFVMRAPRVSQDFEIQAPRVQQLSADADTRSRDSVTVNIGDSDASYFYDGTESGGQRRDVHQD